MKKTQVALAALALVASSAAMAQVSIYGNLEGGIAKTTDVSAQASLDGGYTAGNLWGLRGSEDLTNGLKASFVLEQGIDLNGNVDNGGNGSLFNRQGFVSLSSDSLGTVAIGQQLSPYIAAMAGNVAFAGNGHFWVNRLIMAGGSGGLQAVAAGDNTVQNFAGGGFFQRNAITYTAPAIAGFTISAMTTLKQGPSLGANTLSTSAPADVASDRYDAISASGDVAGLGVSLAYQKRKDTYSTMGFGLKYAVANGVNLIGNVIEHKNDTDSTKTRSYALGASYALSEGTTIAAQIAQNNLDDKQRMYGLNLQHNLSKRTFAYAAYTRATNGAISNYSYRAAYAATGDSNSTMAVGVGHSF